LQRLADYKKGKSGSEERLGVTSPPREKPQENVKRKKNQGKKIPVRFPQ
jgi:hypothetical protein